jgi:hypothetical protein
MLCSNIETGIGCVASSVPSLRHYFRLDNSESDSGPSKRQNNSKSFFTVGSVPPRGGRRGSFHNPTDLGFSLTTVTNGKESWERLYDTGNSTSTSPSYNELEHGGIHKEQHYTVSNETWDSNVDHAR